jgi:hypothetical protein
MRKKESVPATAGQITNATSLTRTPHRRHRQRFDHQRAQIVLKHHVFEVAMKLENGRISTPHRSELSTMLGHKNLVK